MEVIDFDQKIYPLLAYRITGKQPQMFWRFITESEGTLLVKPLQHGPLEEPPGLPNHIHSIYDVLQHEVILQIQLAQQLSRKDISQEEYSEKSRSSLTELLKRLIGKRVVKSKVDGLLQFIVHDEVFIPAKRKTYMGGIRVFQKDILALVSKILGMTGVDVRDALRLNMLGDQFGILVDELCDEGLSREVAEAEVNKVNYLLGYHPEQKMTSIDDPPLVVRNRYIYCESVDPVVTDAKDRAELKGVLTNPGETEPFDANPADDIKGENIIITISDVKELTGWSTETLDTFEEEQRLVPIDSGDVQGGRRRKMRRYFRADVENLLREVRRKTKKV